MSLRRPSLVLSLLLALPFLSGPALAGDLLVTLRDVASAEGMVRVAACPPDGYPEGTCRFIARAPARLGPMQFRISGLPEGRFGVSAYHDADADGRLGKDWLGRPTEAVGFGNDAPIGRFGPPDFDAASIAIPATGEVRTVVTLRYR
ncbi:DUF2141 domain-containing protein [Dankookia rubra]|uniref:DUF2141 domain-containing protein n=1 Tax=Dankookia rubra TaxID=1442381 RepID=UPI00140AD405|nr:DUF2141 domain-containing protein [Dankookia rubra]